MGDVSLKYMNFKPFLSSITLEMGLFLIGLAKYDILCDNVSCQSQLKGEPMSEETTVVSMAKDKPAKKEKAEVLPLSAQLYNALGEALDAYVQKTEDLKYDFGVNYIKLDFSKTIPKMKSDIVKRNPSILVEFTVEYLINEQDEALIIVKSENSRKEPTEILRILEADKKKYSSRAKEVVAFIYEEVQNRVNNYKQAITNSVKRFFDEQDEDAILGAYTGIPEEHYHSLRGVSNSQSGPVEKSYNHYEFNSKNPKESTDAQVLGKLAHLKVLEPKRYKKSVFIADLNRTTTEGKLLSQVYGITKADRKIISTKQENQILAMENSFRNHPIAMALYKESVFEKTYFWKVKNTLCRGRLDGQVLEPSEELCELLSNAFPYAKEDLMKSIIVWDLKTTMSADAVDFARQVDDQDYHVQGGAYSDAVEKTHGKPVIYLVVALEKTAPYQVDVHPIDPLDLEMGYKTFVERIEKIEFHQNNPKAWRGYALNKKTFLSRPKYAQNRDMDKFAEDAE
jgi:hypothetical protein